MDDNKSFLNRLGFSLVELMIGMGILAGATLGASKVMEIMARAKKDAEVTAQLKQAFILNQKKIDQTLQGLSMREFKDEMVFFRNSSSAFERKGSSWNISQENLKKKWLLDVGSSSSKDVYSSFNFVKKSDSNSDTRKRFERFYSICIPISEARDEKKFTVEEISNVQYWPFIKLNSDGFMNINCCSLDTPNCSGSGSNPLKGDTDFLLRIVRNDLVFDVSDMEEEDVTVRSITDPENEYNYVPKEIVRMSPTLAETKNFSGAGFFIGMDGEEPSSLKVFSVFYYSECLSKRMRNPNFEVDPKCNVRYKIESKIRSYPVDTAMGGGASDVGNIGW